MRGYVICLVVVILAFSTKLFAASEIAENKIIFGAYGGKSDVGGFYNDKLKSGYSVGIYLDYSFFRNKFLLLESDLSYTNLSLKGSSSSKIDYYSLGLGPVLCFPVWRYFKPYIGLSASINYFELTAILSDRNERTVKFGATGKAGFYIPAYGDISANFGMKYSINELSGEMFQTRTYFAGISYAYNFVPAEEVKSTAKRIEIDEYYESGLRQFNAGDGIKARENFKKAAEYDKHYKDVENYLSIIKKNEENFNNALKLISEDKVFEALPLLLDSEKYIADAREKLKEVRSLLLKEENSLVKLGIEAYNKEDYETCIRYMTRVQLINPDNESVRVYLPRAVKRYNALQKFE